MVLLSAAPPEYPKQGEKELEFIRNQLTTEIEKKQPKTEFYSQFLVVFVGLVVIVYELSINRNWQQLQLPLPFSLFFQ